MNYVVLLSIEFVILLIEEKVMSYVTVSEGHGYPLVVAIIRGCIQKVVGQAYRRLYESKALRHMFFPGRYQGKEKNKFRHALFQNLFTK